MEQRLARVELLLGLHEEAPAEKCSFETAIAAPVEGEFEMAVGQTLFARIGIMALAIGAALTLSQPWPQFPAVLPSTAGWLLALALLGLASWLHASLPLISSNFRAAGMGLLFFATLRLCSFGAEPLLAPSSFAACAALSLAFAINFAIAWSRRSAYLTVVALLTGLAAALAAGTPWYFLGMVTAVLLAAAVSAQSRDWPWLVVMAGCGAFPAYLLWALGNPLFGNRLEVAAGPFAGVWFLPGWMILNALAMTLRRRHATEDAVAQVGAVSNAVGYAMFLLHTLIAHGGNFVMANLVMSIVLLGIAVMFWVREQSRFATFIYAMTGYGALTMALIRASGLPELFVWLSLQSLLVVSTAIWFRSRFIVVANFMIYLAVVACYMVVAKDENGISLGFGLVALISAAVLNRQKHRLELKSELMRNAYLTCAFFIFPHALHHIAPGAWVAPSWIGLAVGYYGIWLVGKSRKYRWMGHGTLLLAVAYLLFIGIGRLAGVQRIVSFLALGTVLLVVSVAFTLLRARQTRVSEPTRRELTPPDSGDA